jgi:hypothetical protein
MPDDLDLRDLDRRYEPDPAFRDALRRRVQQVVDVGASTTTPTTTVPPEEDVIMLTDTRTEAPESSPKRRWLLPAVAAAVGVAIVAGIALAGGSDDGDEQPSASSAVVFEDDFSDETAPWESLLDGMRIEDGEMIWNITPAGQTEFLKPEPTETRLQDSEMTATVVSADPDSTVGLYCRKGIANQDAYYFFRLAPQGALIGVLPPETDTPALTLAEDPAFVRPDGPFELTARCVDEGGVAQLTMLVDGAVVLEGTHDDPLRDGYGALEVTAGATGSVESEVRWDDVTITAR